METDNGAKGKSTIVSSNYIGQRIKLEEMREKES